MAATSPERVSAAVRTHPQEVPAWATTFLIVTRSTRYQIAATAPQESVISLAAADIVPPISTANGVVSSEADDGVASHSPSDVVGAVLFP